MILKKKKSLYLSPTFPEAYSSFLSQRSTPCLGDKVMSRLVSLSEQGTHGDVCARTGRLCQAVRPHSCYRQRPPAS